MVVDLKALRAKAESVRSPDLLQLDPHTVIALVTGVENALAELERTSDYLWSLETRKIQVDSCLSGLYGLFGLFREGKPRQPT